MIEFLIISGLTIIALLAMLECFEYGLSKRYRIKVIGGNVYIPQYRYLILWGDILSIRFDDKGTQEWAQRVIDQDKAKELLDKDIKYIDIK